MKVRSIVAGVATLAALVAGVTGVPTADPPVASAAPSAAPRSAADGILGSFSPLGSGVPNYVAALVVSDDSLYVGGNFAQPTGSSSAKLSVWGQSGSGDDTWLSTGATFGQSATVNALSVKAGDLVAGGVAFGLTDCCIAERRGGTWRQLGSGVDGSVFALYSAPDDTLYVGGSFSTGASGPADGIARWSGSNWAGLGNGMNSWVGAIDMDPSGTLYAGGGFTSAGGVAANYIASWNGSTWSSLGMGTDASVLSLARDTGRGALYVGGGFTVAGGASASAIAVWNGSGWSALDSGLAPSSGAAEARALAIDQVRGLVYVAGRFTGAGGIPTKSVAVWDIAVQQWLPLRWGVGVNDAGLNEHADSIAVDDSTVYVGGSFSGRAGETWAFCGSGGTLRCIAKWTWEPPQGSNSLTGTAGSQITITGEGFIGVPTTGGVKIGGTTVTYTRTSTTSITATAPTAYLDGAAITVDGVGGWGNVGTFSTYVPPPPPVYPPSSPREVTAQAGDAQATVSWLAPSSQGSFPVTSYQVESVPTGGSCLATTLTCEVTGLTNGTSYTFRVRALNGAGWSDWSAASSAVTPAPTPPPPTPSIVITGSRGEGAQSRKVYVDGVAMHLASQQVQARVRLAGQPAYRAGVTVPVGPDSRFTWQRVTGKKTFVSFTSGDVRSNRVVIPPA